MVAEDPSDSVHRCSCTNCQLHPRGAVAREHQIMNQLLDMADEHLRRLLAGLFAQQRGRGGVSQVARITGLARNTIAKGRHELARGEWRDAARIRQSGAGRKAVEEQRPGS